jgi:hypothetical protein
MPSVEVPLFFNNLEEAQRKVFGWCMEFGDTRKGVIKGCAPLITGCDCIVICSILKLY